MNIKTVKNKISLEGELILEHAEEGKGLLLAALDKIDTGKPITIDLAKVSEIDSSGFQLLLSLIHTLNQQDVKFQVKRVKEEIYDLINLAGFNKFFRIDREDVMET